MYLSKNISFNAAVKKKGFMANEKWSSYHQGFVVSGTLPKISLNNTRGLGHNFAPFVTLIDKLSFCEEYKRNR